MIEEKNSINKQIDDYSKRLIDYAFLDVIRAKEGNALMGGFILCFCLIDYIQEINFATIENKLEDGDTLRIKRRYKETINNILGKVNDKYKNKKIKNMLWGCRTSLIHVYGLSNILKEEQQGGFLFHHKDPDFHIILDNKKNIHLNLPDFFCDIFQGYLEMIEQIKTEEISKKKKYLEKMQEQIKIYTPKGIKMSTQIYSKMHQVFIPLDKGLNKESWVKVRENTRDFFEKTYGPCEREKWDKCDKK